MEPTLTASGGLKEGRENKFVYLFKKLDVFPKIPDELKVQNSLSGVVTVIVAIVMTYLMLSEYILYTNTEVTSEVGVDTSFGHKLPIHFDITLSHLSCNDFGLDFMDHAGEQQLEVDDTITKEATSSAISAEACRVHGFLLTNKVAGEFHIAFGRLAVESDNHGGKNAHMHRFTLRELDVFNPSHNISRLAFGESVPGVHDPLDGLDQVVPTGENAQYQYWIKVVPTTYIELDGNEINTNQYSYALKHYVVNTRSGGSFKQPGVYFKYDIAPYRVTYREKHKYFAHFVTQLSAILGGLFVVAGIISSTVLSLNTKLNDKDKTKK